VKEKYFVSGRCFSLDHCCELLLFFFSFSEMKEESQFYDIIWGTFIEAEMFRETRNRAKLSSFLSTIIVLNC
jgi:hypothetical protein